MVVEVNEKAIQAVRKEKGLSVIGLAKALKVRRQSVESLERDGNMPTVRNLVKIMNALNAGPERFFIVKK